MLADAWVAWDFQVFQIILISWIGGFLSKFCLLKIKCYFKMIYYVILVLYFPPLICRRASKLLYRCEIISTSLACRSFRLIMIIIRNLLIQGITLNKTYNLSCFF